MGSFPDQQLSTICELPVVPMIYGASGVLLRSLAPNFELLGLG
jgi:hypothetical protein